MTTWRIDIINGYNRLNRNSRGSAWSRAKYTSVALLLTTFSLHSRRSIDNERPARERSIRLDSRREFDRGRRIFVSDNWNSLPFSFLFFFFFSISPENLIFSMRISTNVSLCYVNTNSITFLLVLAKLLTNSHRGFVIWECDLNDNRGEAHELSSRAREGQEENFGV